MRGKAAGSGISCPVSRITPAYAGKSPEGVRYTGDPEDHPRLCGEKLMCRQKTERRIGSPPPMRGKDFSLLRDNGIDRITPAYAGKSNVIANFDFRSEDHPRLCGEKLLDLG